MNSGLVKCILPPFKESRDHNSTFLFSVRWPMPSPVLCFHWLSAGLAHSPAFVTTLFRLRRYSNMVTPRAPGWMKKKKKKKSIQDCRRRWRRRRRRRRRKRRRRKKKKKEEEEQEEEEEAQEGRTRRRRGRKKKEEEEQGRRRTRTRTRRRQNKKKKKKRKKAEEEERRRRRKKRKKKKKKKKKKKEEEEEINLRWQRMLDKHACNPTHGVFFFCVPSLSLAFTTLGEITVYVTFFHPTAEVFTFRFMDGPCWMCFCCQHSPV